jgi:hypothetical protein
MLTLIIIYFKGTCLKQNATRLQRGYEFLASRPTKPPNRLYTAYINN